MIGIYCLTNKVNGKKYFGQSINIEERKKRYFNYAVFPNDHLKNAFNKYGKENFIFEIIKCCKEKYLDRFEKLYIRIYDTTNREKGYNKDSGGNLNKHRSEETRKKISENMPDRSGENHHNYGNPRNYKPSKETREKISETLTGRTLPEETKKKISETQTGRTLSEETKKKIGEAHTKQYARIIKNGFKRGKQVYGLRFNNKTIKKSISIEKLLDYFLKNYPLEIIKIPKGLI